MALTESPSSHPEHDVAGGQQNDQARIKITLKGVSALADGRITLTLTALDRLGCTASSLNKLSKPLGYVMSIIELGSSTAEDCAASICFEKLRNRDMLISEMSPKEFEDRISQLIAEVSTNITAAGQVIRKDMDLRSPCLDAIVGAQVESRPIVQGLVTALIDKAVRDHVTLLSSADAKPIPMPEAGMLALAESKSVKPVSATLHLDCVSADGRFGYDTKGRQIELSKVTNAAAGESISGRFMQVSRRTAGYALVAGESYVRKSSDGETTIVCSEQLRLL